jgi:apolipoprotein N-acyltransferase
MRQELAALSLGALLVLAFAPFGQGWLAPLLIALLFHLLYTAHRPARAARLGYAFGLGLLGPGVFWLRISIDQFGGVPSWMALLFTLLFIAGVALFFALAGALSAWLRVGRGRGFFMLVAAPLAWLLAELLRAYLFTGFPWLSLGYSQIDLPPAGFAPLLGVFGVGLLVSLSAGLLNLWRSPWALPLLGVLWLTGYGLAGMDWTRARGEPLPVALVQGNVPQSQKWLPSQFLPSLARYRKLSDQAPEARLLVWPETAIAAFDDRVRDSVLDPLAMQMWGRGADLLAGIVARAPDGRYFNAMLGLGISGRQAYYKRHLVPFGEYLPLRPLLQPLLDFLSIPMSHFSPGDGRGRTLRLAGYRVGVDICYEDAFGDEVIQALPRAAFLVNASNDAWFGDSLAPHQHLQIARMRALETGRWLLRATNTGITALIGPHGRVRQRLPQFRAGVLRGRIQPMQGATPYVRWGDAPLGAGALLSTLWLLVTGHRRRALDAQGA